MSNKEIIEMIIFSIIKVFAIVIIVMSAGYVIFTDLNFNLVTLAPIIAFSLVVCMVEILSKSS